MPLNFLFAYSKFPLKAVKIVLIIFALFSVTMPIFRVGIFSLASLNILSIFLMFLVLVLFFYQILSIKALCNPEFPRESKYFKISIAEIALIALLLLLLVPLLMNQRLFLLSIPYFTYVWGVCFMLLSSYIVIKKRTTDTGSGAHVPMHDDSDDIDVDI